jgi:hypothetical protein
MAPALVRARVGVAPPWRAGYRSVLPVSAVLPVVPVALGVLEIWISRPRLRASGVFGIRTVRTPFSNAAVIFSGSTELGSVKERLNAP